MKRYLIKEAFTLQSSGKRLMQPRQYFATDDEAQIKELEKFIADGSVEEIVSEAKKAAKKAKKEPEFQPEEDITVVPGIGAGLQGKLAALEPSVTTVSTLGSALEREDVQKALGPNLEKIRAHFAQ